MKILKILSINLIALMVISSCVETKKSLKVEVVETSRSGSKLSKVEVFSEGKPTSKINLNPDRTFQTFTGFGGSFTESSAYLLNRLSKENRQKIIDAYFAESGARYSLTRTHMNSSDFSLGQYSYAPVEGDTLLTNFSIE
jgi:glucosylceramidase